jgi:4-hydroxybenzoate polyprenyltransferase
MRPKQWIKNVFVYASILFDRKLFDLHLLTVATIGFILLCMMSSTVYLMNDLIDIKSDREHPTKRNRPLAAGILSPQLAIVTAFILPMIALSSAFFLNRLFAALMLLYFLIQIAYSLYLKHVVLIDVMTVASGFVIRVGAGVVLISATRFSPWLYLATTMLALFLVFGRRRHELVLLEGKANTHRESLAHYSVALLDEMIVIVTATTILTYALYTFSAAGLPEDHSMMLTIPFVLYAIFRYLYLIHVKHEGGAPEELVMRDRPLQATAILYAISVIVILYFVR